MGKSIVQEQKIISYLTFRLGEEHFALNVGKVINILELVTITKVPKAPDYFSGVINLRGEVLPVIDTNLKLGIGKTCITPNTCILVIETIMRDKTIKLGALVDAVQEVLEIEDDRILPPPNVGNSFRSEILNGVVEDNDKFIMLIDINRLLDEQEIKAVHAIAEGKVR